MSLDGLPGVPTRTTPTLTPTTLRSIEQTFLELTNETGHSREAGFVPPLVEPSQPTPAQTQNNTVQHQIQHHQQPHQQQQHQPLQHLDNSHNQQQQQLQPEKQVRRNMGGRRPTRTVGISPEEEERRQVRRERNKQAAARCRKRRMDHTNSLVEVSLHKFHYSSKLSYLNFPKIIKIIIILLFRKLKVWKKRNWVFKKKLICLNKRKKNWNIF